MCHILYWLRWVNHIQKAAEIVGQQIRMDQVNGKWAAYELDGSGFHTCKQQQQQKKEQTKTLTLEQMDIRLKRVEKMLFNGGT